MRWSEPAAWPGGKVPGEGDAVTIARDTEVVLDVDPPALRSLTVDGKLSFSRIQDSASRALFAGPRALALGDNGLAAESTDGGAEWQGIELPPELDLKALGVSLETTFTSKNGRPMKIANSGKVIKELFA